MLHRAIYNGAKCILNYCLLDCVLLGYDAISFGRIELPEFLRAILGISTIEDEGTTFLRNVGNSYPVIQCHIPEEVNNQLRICEIFRDHVYRFWQ